MLKHGRKASSDPVQEKLRAEKASFNEEVSSLIDDLIQIKKLINGSPSKFNKEKGNIKEEIPGNPTAILQHISSEFSNIENKGAEIIRKQIEYSKTRKKSKQADNNNNNVLFSEASNKLTRLLSKLKGPYFGDGPDVINKKYRLKFLNKFTDLLYAVKEFEALILHTDKESLTASLKLFEKINNTIDLIQKEVILRLSLMQKEQIPSNTTEVSDDVPNVPVDKLPTNVPDIRLKEEPISSKPGVIIDESVTHAEYEKDKQWLDKKFIGPFKAGINIDIIKEKYLQTGKYYNAVQTALFDYERIAESSRKDIKPLLKAAINFIIHLPVVTPEHFDSLLGYNMQVQRTIDENFDEEKNKEDIKGLNIYDLFDNTSKFRYERPRHIASYKSNLEKFADNILSKKLRLLRHKLPFTSDQSSLDRVNIFDQCAEIKKEIDNILNLLEQKDFDDFSTLLQFKDKIRGNLDLIKIYLQQIKLDSGLNYSKLDSDDLTGLLGTKFLYSDLHKYDKKDIERIQRQIDARKLRKIFEQQSMYDI